MYERNINNSYPILYRLASLFLALLCIFSAFMSGTYAWNEFSGHKTNEFNGISIPVRIVLNKYEKNADGEITTLVVEGASFELYRQNGDSPDPNNDYKIGGLYTTDKNGQIIVHDLVPSDYTYYFLEVNPSYGYVFDTQDGKDINKYFFSIMGQEASGEILVKAYNRRIFNDLEITKTVKNGDGSALTNKQKNILFDFTVNFFDLNENIDENKYSYSINGKKIGEIKSGDIIQLKHNQTAVIHDLPVGIQYTIQEKSVQGYIVSGSNHQGTIQTDGITAQFINTFHNQTGSLTVSKEVIGDLSNTDDEFTFEIKFADGGSYPYEIGDITGNTVDGTAIIKLKHNEMVVFANLPEGINYTVTEIDANKDGYFAVVDKYTGTTTTESIVLPFINYKDSEHNENGILSFDKTVLGVNADKNKKFDFTVIFSDSGNYSYKIDDGEYITHNSGDKISIKHGQCVNFKDIPIGVSYKIIEDNYLNDGYFAAIKEMSGTITGESQHTINFENTKQTVNKLIVRKVVPNEVSEKDKDKEFLFTVTINGVSQRFSLKNGKEKVFILPYDAVYEVKEDNYTAERFVLTSSQQTFFNDKGEKIHEFIFTNTFTGKVEIEISGEKRWNMSADLSKEKPSSVTIYLLDGKQTVSSKIVTAKDNWKYSFTVPKYRADNKTEINYSIDEKTIDGFSKKIVGYDVENTYLKPVVINQPIVQKIIKGDTPKTAENFIFKLEAENAIKTPMPKDSQNGVKFISIEGENTSGFGSITYTSAGIYNYHISEVKGNNKEYTYDKTVYSLTVVVEEKNNQLIVKSITYIDNSDGSNYDKATFTNIYEKQKVDPPKPSDERITIDGVKTWNHGSNPKKEQPKSIIVQLYANGELAISYLVDDNSHWRYSFTVPKFDVNGNIINYTIDEADVKDYTKSIDGFNLTNTHKTVSDPNSPDSNGKDDTQNTGTDSNIDHWLIIMIVSGIALLILEIFGAHQRNSRKNY